MPDLLPLRSVSDYDKLTQESHGIELFDCRDQKVKPLGLDKVADGDKLKMPHFEPIPYVERVYIRGCLIRHDPVSDEFAAGIESSDVYAGLPAYCVNLRPEYQG